MMFMDEKNDKYEQRLVGSILRQKRIASGLSLSEIARTLQISKQYLSDIEHGNKSISYLTVSSIFNELKINFEYTYHEEIKSEFKIFLNSFIYGDIENEQASINAIVGLRQFRDSYSYPYYTLAVFIKNIINEDFCEGVENDVSEMIEYLSSKGKCVCSYYMGELYRKRNKCNHALYNYMNAISYSTEIPGLLGHIYFGIGVVLDFKNDLLHAMDMNNRALNIFVKNNNFTYILYVNLHIGNGLAKMGYVKGALRHYKKTISSASKLNNSEILDQIQINIASMYLYNKEYSNAYLYALKCHEDCNEKNFIMAWSYFYLNEISACRDCIELLKISSKVQPDKSINYLIKIMNYKLSNNHSIHYVNTLIELFEYTCENEFASDQIFVLEMIIEYYSNQQDYKKAYMYLKQLANYYQHAKETDEYFHF